MLVSHSWDVRLLIPRSSRSRCCCRCCCQLIAWVTLEHNGFPVGATIKTITTTFVCLFECCAVWLCRQAGRGPGNRQQATGSRQQAASCKRQLQQIATPKVLLPLSHCDVAVGMLLAFYFVFRFMLDFFGVRLTRWHNNGLAGGSEHDICYRQAYT